MGEIGEGGKNKNKNKCTKAISEIKRKIIIPVTYKRTDILINNIMPIFLNLAEID